MMKFLVVLIVGLGLFSFGALCNLPYSFPYEQALGTKSVIDVQEVVWAVDTPPPASIEVYKAAPRLIDPLIIEALAGRFSIPRSLTIPEGFGQMADGVYSFEDYSQEAPKALYYQPALGLFVFGIDPSGGFSFFNERSNEGWPYILSEADAYQAALQNFRAFGLSEDEFWSAAGDKLFFTTSHKYLGWFDPATQTRKREATTITLKFYRKIGEYKVASAGQFGAALFEFGPHGKLTSVEWRMRGIIPGPKVELKGRKEILADLSSGRAFASQARFKGSCFTVRSVSVRPFEGPDPEQKYFLPVFEIAGDLENAEGSKRINLYIYAVK